MTEKTKRRERSELSREDCLLVLEFFAKQVVRFAETTDPGPFVHPSGGGSPAMGRGHISVNFMIEGSFGSASDLFEAIRVLRGWKLPRKELK